jgi:hypothetical protein
MVDGWLIPPLPPEASLSDFVRTAAIAGVIGALVAGCLAVPAFLPSAMAREEPAKTLLSTQTDLFPKPFDPNGLVKFDVHLADSVSTDVERTETVKKVGFGVVSYVSVVHTASGTYSDDGLASPYVKYPGIEVAAHRTGRYWRQYWRALHVGWVRDGEAIFTLPE